MKVKRTLVFPFEQQTPYTSSKLSLLQMAAQWLETTMQALKESKQQRHESAESNIPDCLQERLLRNCLYRPSHQKKRQFQPVRSRLKASPSLFRAGRYHW